MMGWLTKWSDRQDRQQSQEITESGVTEISFQQADEYFTQIFTGINMTQNAAHAPDLVVSHVMSFLKDMSWGNGEGCIGERTIRQIRNGSWNVCESELNALYQQSPAFITEQANEWLCGLDMPPESHIVKPVQSYAPSARVAYVFLTEAIMRMTYGFLFASEPAPDCSCVFDRNGDVHRHDQEGAAV